MNGAQPPNKPIELSIGLPHCPGTRIYIHLTILATSLVLFITSGGIEAGQSGAAMGSFIYAMPDVRGQDTLTSTLQWSNLADGPFSAIIPLSP